MNTLALETSTEICSVALAGRDGIVTDDTRRLSRTHNEHLLLMIERLLHDRSVPARQIERVAFGAGPGSFTGVRIAAAVAQAVALVSGAAIVPVSSSAALAHAGHRDASPGVVTAYRSRRDAYYVAAYEFGDSGPRCVVGDRLVYDSDATESTELPSWPVVGDGASWLCERWRGLGDARPDVRATALNVLAMSSCARAYIDPAAGIPVYVPGDSPWRPA